MRFTFRATLASLSIVTAGLADGYSEDDLQSDLDAVSNLGATRLLVHLTVPDAEPLVAISGSDTEGDGGQSLSSTSSGAAPRRSSPR